MNIFFMFLNEEVETQVIETAKAESELNLVYLTPDLEAS